MFVAWFEGPAACDRAAIGGKGAGLADLHQAGFPVPRGFVVTMAAFRRSLDRNDVGQRLLDLFDEADESDHGAENARRARHQILDSGPDPEVESAIRQGYGELERLVGMTGVPVAVRSSASLEDLADASFAGQQDTYLWIRGADEVVNHVVRCWASLYTDRAVAYRSLNGYPLAGATMAVVVQEMVVPVASGVVMTLDPRNGDRSKVAIDSAFGLGEAVVSGMVTPDHFVVDKVVRRIVRRTISRKDRECVIADDRVGFRSVEPHRAVSPSLCDGDVARLTALARRVEEHFGRPQDIEWALVARDDGPGEFVVLQSRPETVWGTRPTCVTAGAPGGLVDDIVESLAGRAAEAAGGPAQAALPSPFSVGAPPGADGWESLYPVSLRFDGERPDEENAALWFRDGVHWPRVVSPFDATILQYSLTSLSQYNSRHFVVPAALGVDCRILNGYAYVSPIALDDPGRVEARTEAFRERAGYYYEHWDELYTLWRANVREVIDRLGAVHFDELPEIVPITEVLKGRGTGAPLELSRSYHELLDLCLELWQYHFEFLNLGYAAYLEFFEACTRLFPDIPELAVARMVSGIDVDLFRPDQELRRLARAAVDQGIVALLCNGTIDEAMARMAEDPASRRWWADYTSVHDPWFNYSNGSGMSHDDAVWLDRPDLPFSFLRGYVEQLVAGEDIEAPVEQMAAERDRITAEYVAALPDASRQGFLAKLELARKVFHYVENHNFYIEHWGLSVFWRKVRELSRVFVAAGTWSADDDIFLLRREEVDVALWDTVASWASGRPARNRWPDEIARRRQLLAACAASSPPAVLGTAPTTITEPFTVMLWGMTSESIRHWVGGASSNGDLEGFAASPGVAVGPARVVRSAEEIADVRPGEVLVTALTAPSWAPVFRRIAATVTDTGGIMSHAAIVCREYGLPAVTGTAYATELIHTGQLLRVDGNLGRVTILDPQPCADSPNEEEASWTS